MQFRWGARRLTGWNRGHLENWIDDTNKFLISTIVSVDLSNLYEINGVMNLDKDY